MTDVLIVGAGPAGLTAAIYAARSGLSAKVFDKSMYGGQIILTSEVENFPSIQNISGTDLAINLYTHATAVGAEVLFEEVTNLELLGETKRLSTATETYEGRSVIIAGGAVRRKLGAPGEEKFIGRGVSFCATCDATLYRNKTVAIVGGGNTALEDALFLANQCPKVYLIHRRDEFRGEKILQEAVKARSNIEICYNATVAEVLGEEKVSACVLDTPEGQKTLNIDGLFVAIGLQPESALYAGQLPVSDEGYIIAGESCSTPIPGVFVAGDLRTKTLRQIITASSDGAVAAVAAATYCNAEKQKTCSAAATPPEALPL